MTSTGCRCSPGPRSSTSSSSCRRSPASRQPSLMLYFDRHARHGVLQAAAQGGDPLLWQHLLLVLRSPRGLHPHPAGLRRDLARSSPCSRASPSSATAPWSSRPCRIGFLGFLVWAHHMFAVGLPTYGDIDLRGRPACSSPCPPASRSSTGWPRCGAARSASSRRDAVRLRLPGLFTIGGMSGVTFAAVPFDWQVTDSYFVVGHFHYVLLRRHAVRRVRPASTTGSRRSRAAC